MTKKAAWRLTENQKSALARRYAAGEKVVDLAREYGLSPAGVCKVAGKRVPLRRARRPPANQSGEPS